MIFSTPIFIFCFLPLFLASYQLLPFKNIIFLLFSLLFYAWGEPIFILLMVAVIGINYVMGLLLASLEERYHRLIVLLSVILNLAPLLYFKYSDFIIANINEVLVSVGSEPLDYVHAHLPLGISFYIFQSLTYIVDIYRKQADVEKNPINLALYISMFPQLVAGPIVRFEQISKAIRNRQHQLGNFYEGSRLFIIGLGKKVLIADVLAVPCDKIFSAQIEALPASTAWFGILCFTLQIYYDFSGYTDMARGLGKVVGFDFPENFNLPYTSRSIQEFWRRWHITLSTWFRDYVYIPLGGNRRGAVNTIRNISIVFLLTGAWHGADWKYVVWGGIHGLFLIGERSLFGDFLKHKCPTAIQHLYALIIVILAWVFFRAPDLGSSFDYILSMFGLNHANSLAYPVLQFIPPYTLATFIVGAIFCFNIYKPLDFTLRRAVNNGFNVNRIKYSSSFVLLLLIFTLSLAAVSAQTHKAFIYFRF